MSQPSFAPILVQDRVRPAEHLHAPRPWLGQRPGDRRGRPRLPRHQRGVPGPDQGYALLLAERVLEGRLSLEPEEDHHDVLAALAELAGARAARFGRAPVAADLEWAAALLGYRGAAPAELVAWRRRMVQGAGHEDRRRRRLVDAVLPATLRLGAEEVQGRLVDWPALLRPGARPGA
jgi:hypothetical protein